MKDTDDVRTTTMVSHLRHERELKVKAPCETDSYFKCKITEVMVTDETVSGTIYFIRVSMENF